MEWNEKQCNRIEDPLGMAAMDCAIHKGAV
jgi:hypothetical protein